MKKENDCSGVEEEEEHEAEKRDENDDKEEEEKDDNEEDDEDAKAHHHVEPESAKQPMAKRDRTLIINTSDGVEPPKKINKLSCLFPETRTGLDLVDSDGVTATLFAVPAASGGGERTSPLSPLAEENIVAGNRGAKRTCALKKCICRGCAAKEG